MKMNSLPARYGRKKISPSLCGLNPLIVDRHASGAWIRSISMSGDREGPGLHSVTTSQQGILACNVCSGVYYARLGLRYSVRHRRLERSDFKVERSLCSHSL
ncbi:hypothetical protein B0H17DRAFT_1032835 [Mycena rosella]|uniref:Uncharacterized protein n=1 Tax=Mycena rosella TaxID=1033263 RepID=A0AAD7GXV8_MYCRO|nr:hypothetical protein B0H17DRAFT_1032835 [Mycena rosella]